MYFRRNCGGLIEADNEDYKRLAADESISAAIAAASLKLV